MNLFCIPQPFKTKPLFAIDPNREEKIQKQKFTIQKNDTVAQ